MAEPHRDIHRDINASCRGKARFESPQVAWRAAQRQRGRMAYRCDHCGRWHVGPARKRHKMKEGV